MLKIYKKNPGILLNLVNPVKPKIRTLIVDDEPLARRNLRVLLERDPQVEILDECRNGREAVKIS